MRTHIATIGRREGLVMPIIEIWHSLVAAIENRLIETFLVWYRLEFPAWFQARGLDSFLES
jgi:hypothetical protein